MTMPGPLQGIKVVEVAMWAFVPAAGGMLSDLGATVIKVEPPTGDPLRALVTTGYNPAPQGFVVSWENYNRGKRSITLDLRREEGVEVFYKLLADADVFLTNLLPAARKRMKIDAETLRARFPNLIYAVGSGVGQHGPEAEKGGYDAITYWARSGISSATTPDDQDFPVGPPGPAFGDCASASVLAGAVSAAIAQRAMTGRVSEVNVSLLAVGMWSMQRGITEAALEGKQRFPRPPRGVTFNPIVNVYKTKDGRFLSLCMLEGQRYWAPLCEVAGRPDLIKDPRFATAVDRQRNSAVCVAELDALFLSKTLAEWKDILTRQDGPWEVVQYVGELKDDRQVIANGYLQPVDYGDGRTLHMVSVPMQFDGAPLPAHPAPALGADSDTILKQLGYAEERIIELKVEGVVF
jgi:crotonobetainyl-CoA:carnitine CoA-transferase CaiB-like acyl-CoA transferase